MDNVSLEKLLTLPRLKRTFFARDTLVVARELIGKILVVNSHAVLITETEAYIGTTDRAAHSRFGKTTRNSIMWDKPGSIYIFLIYGMHLCLNIVTEEAGFPAAVLIRGGVWLADIKNAERLDGPGRLTRALGLTKKEHGLDITTAENISLREMGFTPKVVTTPRIGVEYAGSWAAKPWRFVAQLSRTDQQTLQINSVPRIYTHQTAPTPSRSHGSRIALGRQPR